MSLFLNHNIFAKYDVCVVQTEDPACLYEVGKTVLCYEDEAAKASLYLPLGESESSQTSGGDSGNYSQDETETSSSNKTTYRPDDKTSETASSVCVVNV